MRIRTFAAMLVGVWSVLAVPAAWSGSPSDVVTVAGFGEVPLYAPRTAPFQVVLFVSGDGGWNLGVVAMAEALRDQGALVAGIDIRTFVKTLNAGGSCAYPAGDLERLSRTVQLRRRLAEYKPPILVGYSSGATLVYAAIAAAPPQTFAGAISLGFGPDLEITRAPCQQNGLRFTRRAKGPGFTLAPDDRLKTPWMVLQGEVDQVCAPAVTRAFVAAVPGATLFSLPNVGHGFAVTRNWQAQYLDAYRTIAAHRTSSVRLSTPSALGDLPLEEVPGSSPQHSDTMAVILTGDGGWADLDKHLAEAMAARGIPSVGWNSLRYYWSPRTPDAAAADLARIIRGYTSQWAVNRVLLVGYSFGADVLPFLVNRLPADVLAHVRAVALLGLSPTADFEFHVAAWIRPDDSSPYRTVPEVERLSVPVLCIRGADENASACRELMGAHVTSRVVGEGHHFSGNYARLVDLVIETYR